MTKFYKVFYSIIFLLFFSNTQAIGLNNSDFELSSQCKDDLKSVTKSNFKGIEALKYKINTNDFGTCPSDKKNGTLRVRLSTDTIDKTKEIEFSFNFAFSDNPNTAVRFLEFDNWAQGCEFSNPSVTISAQNEWTGGRWLDKNQKTSKYYNNDNLTKIGEWNVGIIKLRPSKEKEIYEFSYIQNQQEILNTEIFIGDCAEVEFAIGPQQTQGEGQNYDFYLSNLVSGTGISECDALKDLSSELKILFVSASTLSYRKKVGEDEPGCEETADYLSMELNNEVDNYAASGSGALTKNAPHKNRFDTMTAGLDLTDYDWIFLGAGVGLLYTGDNQQAYQVTNQLLNSKADQGLLIRKFKDFHENGGKLILGMPTQFSQKNKDKKYHRLLKSGFELIDRIKILAKNREDVFFVGFQDNLINPDDESFYDKKFDGVHLTPEGHKLVAQKIAEIIKNN
jgi:hypothetical protein